MRLWSTPQSSQNLTSETQKLVHWQETVLLAATVSVFLVVEIRAAALRPFWYDELSTMIVTSAPTLREMLRAIPSDGNPPLYFLLARLCLRLPIRSEIALRLPSIAAINITALMVYLFVRRNTGAIFSFLAMSIFLGSWFAFFAALEARPYALLLCFTSVAICIWQSAARGRNRRLALAGITAAMVGAIFSHQYGVIYVTVPLVAGEGIRSLRDRRFHLHVFAAALVGATSLVITFPPMLRAQAGLLKAVKLCPVFWARPTLQSLMLYRQTVPIHTLKLLSVLIAAALIETLIYVVLAGDGRWGKVAKRVPEAHIEDLAVGSALVLILPIMLLISKLETGYFQERYAVGSSLGVALVSGLLFSSFNERFPKIKAFVFAGIAYCFLVGLHNFWYSGPFQPLAGVQSDPLFLSAPAQEPLVMSDALIFLPTWWYSDPSVRARLHYLTDLNYAVKQPDFVPEYGLANEEPYGAPKLDDYKEFLAAHREFLLYYYGTPRVEWVKSRLSSDGWRLILIRSEGAHELYRVTGPGAER
jgi:hypothetical protein